MPDINDLMMDQDPFEYFAKPWKRRLPWDWMTGVFPGQGLDMPSIPFGGALTGGISSFPTSQQIGGGGDQSQNLMTQLLPVLAKVALSQVMPSQKPQTKAVFNVDEGMAELPTIGFPQYASPTSEQFSYIADTAPPGAGQGWGQGTEPFIGSSYSPDFTGYNYAPEQPQSFGGSPIMNAMGLGNLGGALSPILGIGADILSKKAGNPIPGTMMGMITNPWSSAWNAALGSQTAESTKSYPGSNYISSILGQIPVLGQVLGGMLGGIFGKDPTVSQTFYYPGIGYVPTDVDPALNAAANQHELLKLAYQSKLQEEATKLSPDFSNLLEQQAGLQPYQSLSLPELGYSSVPAQNIQDAINAIYSQVYSNYGGTDIGALMSPQDQAIWNATSPEVQEQQLWAANAGTGNYLGGGLWAGEFA